MHNYLIRLAPETLTEIERLAVPYFLKPDCADLARAVGAVLAPLFPKRSIRVLHIPCDADLFVPQIRLLVVVDEEMDQGLIVRLPAPEPANDHQAVVAATRLAA